MPQQRRKTAFSGKKKKQQITQKRLKNNQKFFITSPDLYEDSETTEDNEQVARKLMLQPSNRQGGSAGSRPRNANRYNLQFYQESKRDLELMRSEAFTTLCPASDKDKEIDCKYFEGYDFPLRPAWDYSMDKQTLEKNENRYFKDYVDKIKQRNSRSKELSLFEINLETWRQLWRVLEISDVFLITVDIRFASLMFPPFLYQHITETLKKRVILVLNKVDLVAPEAVVAWQHYFAEHYPSLPIVLFASYPQHARNRTQKGYKRSMEGVHNIYRECHKIVDNELDITQWEQKILEDMQHFESCDTETEVLANENACTAADAAAVNESNTRYHNGMLTIGCIGLPNVGKSSLINALKGRKVVSVSRTPGHTKHFQTIFITNIVRLCDCPGLVFPSSTPKHLQVLLGSFPISQLQVPYRSLKFVAEHLNIPQLLKLQMPEDFEDWCAAAIADAWALKRGFLTARAARPDRYRAANQLLRNCLIGQQQLVLQFYPPGFHEHIEKWLTDSNIELVKKYQNKDPNNDADDVHYSDAWSINSDTCKTEEESDSNDETNDDENDDDDDQTSNEETVTPKSHNVFALLEDD